MLFQGDGTRCEVSHVPATNVTGQAAGSMAGILGLVAKTHMVGDVVLFFTKLHDLCVHKADVLRIPSASPSPPRSST